MIAQCRYCLELIDGGPAPPVSAEVVAALKALKVGLASPHQAKAPAASPDQAGRAGRKRRHGLRFGRVRGPAAAQRSAALPPEFVAWLSRELTSEDVGGLLEFQQLGQKMFHHLEEAHPDKAGSPRYQTTVLCNFLYSLHFSGTGDFSRWQKLFQEQAISEIGKPIIQPVADAHTETTQNL